MTITFKVIKECADEVILGLAKSGVPVSAMQDKDGMAMPGNVYVTANFPDDTAASPYYFLPHNSETSE